MCCLQIDDPGRVHRPPQAQRAAGPPLSHAQHKGHEIQDRALHPQHGRQHVHPAAAGNHGERHRAAVS